MAPGAVQFPLDIHVPSTFQAKQGDFAKFQKAAAEREAEQRLAGAGGAADRPGQRDRLQAARGVLAARRRRPQDHARGPHAGDPLYAEPLHVPLVLVSDDDDGRLAKLKAKEQIERLSFRFLVEGAEIAWQVKEQTASKVVFVGEGRGRA